MPRTLPFLPDSRVAVCVATCLMLWVGMAHAIDIDPGAIDVRQGRVEVAVRVSDLFPPRVEESLVRGMPATLLISAELWRHRTGWFDRLSSHFIDFLVPDKLLHKIFLYLYVCALFVPGNEN